MDSSRYVVLAAVIAISDTSCVGQGTCTIRMACLEKELLKPVGSQCASHTKMHWTARIDLSCSSFRERCDDPSLSRAYEIAPEKPL